MSLETKTRRIQMILSDVDGVLTDGTIRIDHQGNESKDFSTADGFGIRHWMRTGHVFGLITGRAGPCVLHRAGDLGIEIVRLGTSEKRRALEEISAETGIPPEHIAYIGDDFPDLPAIRAAGFGVTVPDAPEELRAEADYITTRPGGRGAVRDLIDLILKRQGTWNPIYWQA